MEGSLLREVVVLEIHAYGLDVEARAGKYIVGCDKLNLLRPICNQDQCFRHLEAIPMSSDVFAANSPYQSVRVSAGLNQIINQVWRANISLLMLRRDCSH